MALTLTVADNQDGSGCVFTVTDAAPGDAITVYVSRFQGSNTDREFVVAGVRLGPGTVPYACEPGVYLAVVNAVSGPASGIAPPVVYRTTNGAISMYEQVLVAVREYVMSLLLPGVPTDPARHVICKIGAKLQELLRSGNEGVYYLPTQESLEFADNSYTTLSLPVSVVIVTRSGSTLRTGLSALLIAREDLMFSLDSAPLPDLPWVHTVDVEPAPVIDGGQWGQGLDVSVITITAKTEAVDGLLG